MKYLVRIAIFLIVPMIGISQSPSHREKIKTETNIAALQRIIQDQSILQNQLKANRSQYPESIIVKGQKAYLATIDSEGIPRYVTADNYDAAVSVKVDELWSGGDSGYDLDGEGIIVGVWEAGGVALAEHNELEGRVEVIDEMADVTFHATHVTGTIISEGNNINARGMAPGAIAKNSDSDNDIAELASYALDGGLLTNHSYGTILTQNNQHVLGIYTSAAGLWDRLLFNSPYLLSCKSAGNTRDDGFNSQDNGYDQLLNASCAKNNLVVGAIDDVDGLSSPTDFNESSFSSWGPTDDWRIKPDITANGVGVFSCSNQGVNAYNNSSGTSMSVATVTGAAALLQQYYERLNGEYMKSATVKALILGTADELGPHDGPDFREGWGLMNARKAADAIFNNGTESLIRESSINEYTTDFIPVQIEAGAEVSVMIAWTDPDNPDVGQGENLIPSLMNDLDVRLIGPDGTYMPWMMDPQIFGTEFGNAAIKGDNFRDNVERINATIIEGGVYEVIVSHKNGILDDYQDYSLVITGIEGEATGVDEVLAENVKIYPNPNMINILTIDLSGIEETREYDLNILDLNGKSVMNTSANGNEQLSIDISQLIDGIYVLSISSERGTYTERVVVY